MSQNKTVGKFSTRTKFIGVSGISQRMLLKRVYPFSKYVHIPYDDPMMSHGSLC